MKVNKNYWLADAVVRRQKKRLFDSYVADLNKNLGFSEEPSIDDFDEGGDIVYDHDVDLSKGDSIWIDLDSGLVRLFIKTKDVSLYEDFSSIYNLYHSLLEVSGIPVELEWWCSGVSDAVHAMRD